MKLIVGNLKMNLNFEEIKKYKSYIEENFTKEDNIVICPSYPFIETMKNSKILLGAQDLYFTENGSYTGCVSGEQLKSLSVKYVIIGHSERRKYFNENNLVNKKLNAAFKNTILPILCIGESLGERENGQVVKKLSYQIDEALQKLKLSSEFIIAYEPIWAIGTGIIPTSEKIEEVITFIKGYISKKYDKSVKVLYGGSVNQKNANEIINQSGADGALIGTACKNPRDFLETIKAIEKI